MKQPKIIINCAMSADGKIASASGKQVRISSEEDMKRVYQLRHSVDAVLVGINTVLNDDPKLTVKKKYVSTPHQPIRIVLDAQCRTPQNALIVNNKAKTIIIKDEQVTCSKTFHNNVSIVSVPAEKGKVHLNYVLDHLSTLGISSILVEGGGTVIWNFIKHRLVDELYVFIGSMIIGGKQTPTMTMGKGFENENDFIRLHCVDFQQLGDGLLLHYRLK